MLKIGEFSILSTISIHMLRHYDEIGLLIPDHTDRFSGYRYYREDQLLKANQILAFKSMGFGLKEIRQILKGQQTDEQIRLTLAEKKQEKENQIRELQSQLQQISCSILEFGKSNEYCTNSELSGCYKYSSQIAVKEIPKRQVVSYRSRIKAFHEEGVLWTVLNEESAKLKIDFSGTEYDIAILHEVNEEEQYIDVEVQKAVDSSAGVSEKLEFKAVEAEKVASLVFQGGYSKLAEVNAYAAQWILNNNYELNGRLFNIYHISPGSSAKENEFITEVCFPIREKRSTL